MKIYSEIPQDLPRTALTIGTFDGVHIGHQALLTRLKNCFSHATVLTFTNHPLEILKPDQAPKLLTSISVKLELLEKYGIDVAITIPFTKELANLTYEAFLDPFPLAYLVLGADTAFGKNREGNRANILKLAQTRGFKVEYLEKVLFDGEPVSSRRIRTAIANKDFNTAKQLLGHQHYV